MSRITLNRTRPRPDQVRHGEVADPATGGLQAWHASLAALRAVRHSQQWARTRKSPPYTQNPPPAAALRHHRATGAEAAGAP